MCCRLSRHPGRAAPGALEQPPLDVTRPIMLPTGNRAGPAPPGADPRRPSAHHADRAAIEDQRRPQAVRVAASEQRAARSAGRACRCRAPRRRRATRSQKAVSAGRRVVCISSGNCPANTRSVQKSLRRYSLLSSHTVPLSSCWLVICCGTTLVSRAASDSRRGFNRSSSARRRWRACRRARSASPAGPSGCPRPGGSRTGGRTCRACRSRSR